MIKLLTLGASIQALFLLLWIATVTYCDVFLPICKLATLLTMGLCWLCYWIYCCVHENFRMALLIAFANALCAAIIALLAAGFGYVGLRKGEGGFSFESLSIFVLQLSSALAINLLLFALAYFIERMSARRGKNRPSSN